MSGGQPEYRGNAAQSEAVVTGICASYTASVVAHNTLSGSGIDGGSHVSGAARTTFAESGIGGGRHASGAARTTLPGYDIGGGSHVSVAARNTPTGSGISGGLQLTGELQLFLYIEASTNPLPSGYAFNAASPIAKLQHGYVNPLPKETLHHG